MAMEKRFFLVKGFSTERQSPSIRYVSYLGSFHIVSHRTDGMTHLNMSFARASVLDSHQDY